LRLDSFAERQRQNKCTESEVEILCQSAASLLVVEVKSEAYWLPVTPYTY